MDEKNNYTTITNIDKIKANSFINNGTHHFINRMKRNETERNGMELNKYEIPWH